MKRLVRQTWLSLLVLLYVASNLCAEDYLNDPPPAMQMRDVVQDVFERIWIPSSRLTDGPHVRKVFRPLVAEPRQATVQVRCNGERVAYGAIVGPDGWVVTKATRLDGPIQVRLADGETYPAELIGRDLEVDLAMLKIEAAGLPFYTLSPPPEGTTDATLPVRPTRGVVPGDWVITVGAGLSPLAVGVVSVAPRRIEQEPGFLGIQANQRANGQPTGQEPGVQITHIIQNSGAERAGLRVGDRIVEAQGEAISVMAQLQRVVTAHQPGDWIELRVVRDDESITRWAQLLGARPEPQMSRSNEQNRMGGKLSMRRAGFPRALQHDTVLRPEDCGGPVLDTEGRLVGINLARAGRTESFLLPADDLARRLYPLMAGHLAPRTDPSAQAAEAPSQE